MNVQLEVDGKPVATVSASGSPGAARLLAGGEPVPDDATVTISARLLAETLVAYAGAGANGLLAQQAGEAVRKRVVALLYAATAAARRR